MKEKIVYSVEIAGYQLLLVNAYKHGFYVVYGVQIKSGLSLLEAAHEFGECMIHALALDGKLDN